MRKHSLNRVGFGSLAMRYYPDLCYKSALRLFRHEISTTRGLLPALKECGYREHNRIITHEQLTLLENFLGKP